MTNELMLSISHKKIEDVFMWRDVRVSGAIFAAMTLAYLLLEWSGYSLFCLSTYAVFILVLGLLSWNYIAFFIKTKPLIPSAMKDGITEREAKKAMEKAVPYVNKLLATVNSVITGKDLRLSLKVLGSIYMVARISAVISLFTLVYLVVLIAFIVPKVYEMRKEQIGSYIAVIVDKLKKYYTQLEAIMKKIPNARTASTIKKIE